MVGDDGFGEAMQAYYMLQDQPGKFGGVCGLVTGCKVNHLGEAVYEHQQGVITFGWR